MIARCAGAKTEVMGKNSLSLGSEQLAAAGTVTAVAKTLGVADRTVAGWRAGKVPNRASIESIERLLGIPSVAWSRVPLASLAAAPPTSLVAAPVAPAQPSARQSAEERLREQLERLRAQREVEGLTERSRVELEKLELQASARLARLEGATGLTMKQIMATPHVSRLTEALMGCLNNSPLELFAVIDALEMLEDRAPTPWRTEDIERDHPGEVRAVRDANAALLAVMRARAEKRAA